jgi:hypothetical protein
MVKFITRENIPCWYELSWDKKTPGIILRIHRDFIKNTEFDFLNSWQVKELMEDFKFPEFKADFNQDIGFGGAFKNQGKNKDGFWNFLVEIPQIKTATGVDFRQADIISGSFTTLTNFLSSLCKKETSTPFSQLITLNTITKSNLIQKGYSFSGEISFLLRRWLADVSGRREIPEVIQAMKTAYQKMSVSFKYYENEFRMNIWENGGLSISCPGDACSLYSDQSVSNNTKGYKFGSDNVDNPMQQITLLAGLAALHDRARKEIKE